MLLCNILHITYYIIHNKYITDFLKGQIFFYINNNLNLSFNIIIKGFSPLSQLRKNPEEIQI